MGQGDDIDRGFAEIDALLVEMESGGETRAVRSTRQIVRALLDIHAGALATMVGRIVETGARR